MYAEMGALVLKALLGILFLLFFSCETIACEKNNCASKSLQYRMQISRVIETWNLYEMIKSENAPKSQGVVRLYLERDSYNLIRARAFVKDISRETQRVDCTISYKIERLIKLGEIFSGKQEFSYKPENAYGLIPDFCANPPDSKSE